jgi:predicted DNA-binding transcriptional regulator AlpA
MKGNAMCDKTRKERLLTARAVGEMLSLSKQQVFRLNNCRKLPAPIRIGGAVRWSEITLLNWLQAGAPERRIFEAMMERDNEHE